MNQKHVFDTGNVLDLRLDSPIYGTYEQETMWVLTIAEPDNSYMSEADLREGKQGYAVCGTQHWPRAHEDLAVSAFLFAKERGRLPERAGEALDTICTPALRLFGKYAQVKLDNFLRHRRVLVDDGYGCVARVQHFARTPDGLIASLDFKFAQDENAFAVARLPSGWENMYGVDLTANYGLFQFADRRTVIPVTEEQFNSLLKGSK